MKQTRTAVTDALPTKERLSAAALALFSSEWFDTVSVVEICRRAGLSNGIFYRYFKTKQEVFQELLDRFLELFSERLQHLPGRDARSRLLRFIETTVGTSVEHRDLVTVFHEGQYRFPKVERRVRDVFMRALSEVFEREVTETEYLYVVAGVRFVTVRSIFGKLPVSPALLRDAIWDGVFTKPLARESELFSPPAHPLEPEEPSSASRLIDAGVRLFGKRGYHTVNVYDIAKAAGFAVGSFYLYFPTKEAFLAEIVRLIGKRTRRFITTNLDPSLNRLEQELRGLHLFLQHFSKHPEYYAIVREAEFVVNEEASDYYDRFESGYVKDLAQVRAQSRSEKRLVANFLMGIAHQFGIEALFNKTIADQNSAILELGRYLYGGIRS